MQIPRDALSFLESFFHAHADYPRHLPEPELIKSKERKQKQDNYRDAKPRGLIVSRCDVEIDVGARLVPYAFFVASHNAKAIGTGIKIVIEHLPAISGILPIAIATFQFVPKENF